MNIFSPTSIQPPVSVTIGNFDGVHLGHQAVISTLLNQAEKDGSQAHVITFKNHPSSILSKDHEVPLITTLTHRIHLIETLGVKNVVLLPFTKELADLTAECFIEELLPFHLKSLVLGFDARFGKDREGDEETLRGVAKKHHFNLFYVKEKEGISSSEIRKAIQSGDLKHASEKLGRPYSILSRVVEGKGRGKKVGYPTANLNVESLILPPLGVYSIDAKVDDKKLPGIANLGVAPTVRTDPLPQLEVHLFNFDQEIRGKEIEVIFKQFIRQERKFASVDALREQIAKDIQVAQH